MNFILQTLGQQNTKNLIGANSHAHTNSLLSGVFYFQVDEKSGKLWFQKEIKSLYSISNNIDLDVTEYNILNSKEVVLNPKKQLLYLFPSWLLHNVNNNESDE